MPGKLITTKQVEIYMIARKENCTQVISAAKAGISERSGRNIEHKKWGLKKGMRNWKTRKDPLNEVWENELEFMLNKEPGLNSITLLEVLQERYPGKYGDNVLRTLQRRVKEWRALKGPDKDVIFRQEHVAGRLGISDFTTLKGIIITIRGKALSHILYHFRLAYSGWSFMKVILGGESYTALTEGLQEALWRLGGSPQEHRTDSLSAAFKNLNKEAQNDTTEKYENFCKHYNMQATRNNRGIAHENGSIESPHGHLKRRIQQALLVRGSNDFDTIEDYQNWLDGVVSQHNHRNAKAVTIEKSNLQGLPNYKAIDYTELLVKVTSSSTIDVRRVTYTIPSRLQGETLRIRLYHDRLVCYLGTTHITDLKRVYTKGTTRGKLINYRHVIKSLVRKPQAFRHSRIRDDLLPNDKYKQIWDYVNKNLESRIACKFIVGLLYIAAEKNCEETLANDVLATIAEGKKLNLIQLQEKYHCPRIAPPLIHVEQHLLTSYDKLMMKEVAYA